MCEATGPEGWGMGETDFCWINFSDPKNMGCAADFQTDSLDSLDQIGCTSNEGGITAEFSIRQMGVSENSVPLNPMVNDYYPY